PRDLASLVRNQELSPAGIQILESSATFGTAVELFGSTRAKALCEKMGIGTDDVYGFNHRQGDQWGKVLAQWDGTQFRLVRVDDVGKLVANETEAAKKMRPVEAESAGKETPSANLMTASREEVLAALPKLREDAESNPEDIDALARYAMVLYRVENYPEAWKQLIAARKLDAKHVGVARGVNTLMDAFTNLGVFTVGVPKETVSALLGEPMQRVQLGAQRERWVYAHWGVDFRDSRVHEIINLLGATEALFRPSESIKVDLDGRGWRTQLRRKQKGRVTAFLFLPGESISEFSEQITVERYVDASAMGTIQEIAEKTIADETTAVAGTKLQVLSVEDGSAYLAGEAPLASSDSGPSKTYRLIRLIRGEKDLHRLQYLIRANDPPDQETQRKWLAIFKSAKLMPVKVE
ncbi:MAG: hypothetical protein AAFU85_20555, partial [Planctomycetota bacterium]